ncbi:hypothetical protein [Rubritalea tangerina]
MPNARLSRAQCGSCLVLNWERSEPTQGNWSVGFALQPFVI